MGAENWFEMWAMQQDCRCGMDNRALWLSFLISLCDTMPDVVAGNEDGTVSIKEIDALLKVISEGKRFEQRMWLRNVLDKLLSAARDHHGWEAPHVPLMWLVRHKRARFSPREAFWWQCFEDLEKQFWRATSVLEGGEVDELSALLFMSFIIWDGVLERQRLLMLLQSGLTDITTRNGECWIDVPVDPRNGVPGMVQRVYLSEITQLILRQIRKKLVVEGDLVSKKQTFLSLRITEKKLWNDIKTLLRKYSIAGEWKPVSLAQMLSVVIADVAVTTPPYLTDYASGKNFAVSVRDHLDGRDYGRVQSGRESNWHAIEMTRELDSYLPEDKGEGGCDKMVDPMEFFEAIQRQIKAGEVRSAEKYSCDSVAVLGEIGSTVLQWHIWRVTNKRRTTGAIFVEDAVYYQFGRYLTAHSLILDNAPQRSYDYEDLYDSVLEVCVTKETLGQFSYLVQEFHDYMKKNADNIPDIDYDNIEAMLELGTGVNAKILSPEDYCACKRIVWEGCDSSNRLEYIRYLILVMGYRIGLRRNEIRRLRMRDIVISSSKVWLHITTTVHGSPKSLAGERVIPVHDLLTSDEIEYLRRWVQIRTSEDSDTAPLLAVDENDDGLISTTQTFDALLRVLRDVSSDETIKFHSLRHSFATLLLIRYEAQRLPALMMSVENRWGGGWEDAPLPSKWRTLVGGGGTPTRKFLYQLASIIGHSTPAMTLRHYIHSCDIILYHHLKARIPMVDKRVLSRLLGFGQSQLYERLRSSTLGSREKLYSLRDCLDAGVIHSDLVGDEW